tara:strand:- start:52630 stop:54558 length:1929 start_codon:yes stop_codon:yes gene_type:complete
METEYVLNKNHVDYFSIFEPDVFSIGDDYRDAINVANLDNEIFKLIIDNMINHNYDFLFEINEENYIKYWDCATWLNKDDIVPWIASIIYMNDWKYEDKFYERVIKNFNKIKDDIISNNMFGYFLINEKYIISNNTNLDNYFKYLSTGEDKKQLNYYKYLKDSLKFENEFIFNYLFKKCDKVDYKELATEAIILNNTAYVDKLKKNNKYEGVESNIYLQLLKRNSKLESFIYTYNLNVPLNWLLIERLCFLYERYDILEFLMQYDNFLYIDESIFFIRKDNIQSNNYNHSYKFINKFKLVGENIIRNGNLDFVKWLEQTAKIFPDKVRMNAYPNIYYLIEKCKNVKMFNYYYFERGLRLPNLEEFISNILNNDNINIFKELYTNHLLDYETFENISGIKSIRNNYNSIYRDILEPTYKKVIISIKHPTKIINYLIEYNTKLLISIIKMKNIKIELTQNIINKIKPYMNNYELNKIFIKCIPYINSDIIIDLILNNKFINLNDEYIDLSIANNQINEENFKILHHYNFLSKDNKLKVKFKFTEDIRSHSKTINVLKFLLENDIIKFYDKPTLYKKIDPELEKLINKYNTKNKPKTKFELYGFTYLNFCLIFLGYIGFNRGNIDFKTILYLIVIAIIITLINHN